MAVVWHVMAAALAFSVSQSMASQMAPFPRCTRLAVGRDHVGRGRSVDAACSHHHCALTPWISQVSSQHGAHLVLPLARDAGAHAG